jgi:cysteine-rich repeat protein
MSGMSGMAGMSPLGCGDGVVGPGEACDPGSEPSPSAFELRQGGFRYEVLPIVGPGSPTDFYDYRSASSHTGFEGVGAARIFLYRWSVEQAMSLVFHAGIDEDATGLTQPESHIVFEVSGLPSTGVVVLSDERMELARTSGTAVGAEWQFRRNTDGGVIGGLPFPGSWHLTVNIQFIEGFVEWTFLSGTGAADEGVFASHLLDMTQPIEIVATGDARSCRSDCTVPACGDGRLDPGEVCDDGNAESGDGCANCLPEP